MERSVFIVLLMSLMLLGGLQAWGHYNNLELVANKDKLIRELREELKAGIFVEVHTDNGLFRRVVNRNDSGHIFIPESSTLIIKARSVWQDNIK